MRAHSQPRADGYYIAFEGPIGAGKTTHAQRLAIFLETTATLENFEGNEFLADFYLNRDRWALPMQLGFLTSRYSQLRALPHAVNHTISDHTYLKDAVFARMLLKDREWRLYCNVQRSLTDSVRPPDLVVFLDAPNEILLERIAKRGREIERDIDAEYLDELRAAYNDGMMAREDLAVMRVMTDDLDLSDEQGLNSLYGRICDKTTQEKSVSDS